MPPRLRRYLYDELCWISLIVGMLLCVFAVTWLDVDLRLGLIGLFMAALMIGGWALHPRMTVTTYDRALSSRNFLGWFLFTLIGLAATTVIHWFAVAPSQATMLAGVDLGTQVAFLALAAISETFFLFWFLECSVASYIHPIAGILVVAVAAGLLHQFVYGEAPVVLLAVALSFAIQAVCFEASGGRLSVPLAIHLGVNLLPFLLQAVVIA